MTATIEQTQLIEPSLDLDAVPAPEAPQEEPSGISPTTLGLAVVSAGLASMGSAWMLGGMFRGNEARLVGLLGVLIGCGLSFAATRWRSSILQYATLPIALLLGAVLMASSSGTGTSSLPALVKDAATNSQLRQPPIDFAPGWRMILIVVLALVSSAACALSLSQSRPRLAVAIPTPLTFAAALVQPSSSAIVTSAISVAFVMMGLATSFAADGAGESFDARFEVRRLMRSALVGVLFVAALIAASKLSFLFPQHDTQHVIPPRRPPVSPPQPDVPLYTVKGTLNGPLRVGVIDVYSLKDQAWLLPPIDNKRLVRQHLPADPPDAPAVNGAPVTLTVTIQQARGHLLPDLASTRHVDGNATADYDPRTQTYELPQRPVFTGLHYTVTANPAPTGKELSAAKGDVPPALQEFLTAPATPPAVQALLSKAPDGAYQRLQWLRTALYKKVVASGQGKPTDVSADRVVQLLGGATANPYELSASEALLARWAGIPSRIGFGYYNGTTKDDGSIEFRPNNASTYLEAYFAPYGWVPIIGTPPKAQQSLSNNQRNTDPSIQAAPELGIDVFLPVLRANNVPLYEYVRYYLYRALPGIAAVALLGLTYPVGLKARRRRKRARWAAEHGPAGVIAVAYCELRDRMIDLALPGRAMTPLELVELVDEDEEHAELAWLVTRGLWGDLRAELTDEDAVTAQRLAASVSERLSKAQPETARLLATIARASLRSPYSAEVPNVWRKAPRLSFRALRVLRVRRTPSPAFGSLAVVLLAVLTLGGCSSASHPVADLAVAFPTRLAPPVLAGLKAHDEVKADAVYLKGAQDKDVIVDQGKVISFGRDGLVQAALQVAQLKSGYTSTNPGIVSAITRSVGKMTELTNEGSHQLFALVDGSQRIYLWFPTAKSMALLVVRTQYTAGAAEAMARGLIDYGDGGTVNETALAAAFSTAPPTPAGAKP